MKTPEFVRWTALSLHCYNFLSCWDMQLMGFSRKQVMTSREKWLERICGNSLWFRCFSHIAWPQRVHKCWACLQCIRERCENACFGDFYRQRKRTTISQAPTKYQKQRRYLRHLEEAFGHIEHYLYASPPSMIEDCDAWRFVAPWKDEPVPRKQRRQSSAVSS